jgi:hypothetical protein
MGLAGLVPGHADVSALSADETAHSSWPPRVPDASGSAYRPICLLSSSSMSMISSLLVPAGMIRVVP